METVRLIISENRLTKEQASEIMACVKSRKDFQLSATNVQHNMWTVRFDAVGETVRFSTSDCIGYNSYYITSEDIRCSDEYLCINGMQINVEKAN